MDEISKRTLARLCPPKRTPNGDALRVARKKYSRHKAQSKYRGIPFLFQFEEWYHWWLQHGVDKNSETFSKQDKLRLCMCRVNDEGPYSADNVYCDTHVENVRESRAVWRRRYEQLKDEIC